MVQTIEMAGFIAAHAVWCVSGGEVLIPIFACERPDGRYLERLVSERAEAAVALGRERLERNPSGASRAVLVVDGYVTLPDGKTDALLIEGRRYGEEAWAFSMAVPYRNAGDAAGFAVYRPKFLAVDGPAPDYATLGEVFFRGVDAHEHGGAVWAERMDQGR